MSTVIYIFPGSHPSTFVVRKSSQRVNTMKTLNDFLKKRLPARRYGAGAHLDHVKDLC
jgi:hypothetical protein